MTTLLEARNLSYHYTLAKKKITILDNVSCEINRGDIVFFHGASGAGKSTLMYLLSGLEKPAQGEVLMNGSSMNKMSATTKANMRNHELGFIFQHYGLMPELNVLENVLLPTQMQGKLTQEEAKKRAINLLKKVGLEDRIKHLPKELSGGEQQRVAIARSLVNQPSVIFADEPTGNLDEENSAKIMELLLDLAEQEQVALIIITHDVRWLKRGSHCYQVGNQGILASQ